MKYLSYILLFTLSQIAAAQDTAINHWNTLSLVTKEKAYDENWGIEIEKVTPTLLAESLRDQEIEIRGYMIALDVKREQTHFMFSRYPQNMCFFCGAAGPESAMQVFLANGALLEHTTDKIVLKGTLKIQQGDATGLIYTLTQAEFIKKIKS